MSDENDSWLAGIGVDVQGFLGSVQQKASAVVDDVKSAGAAVFEQAQGAVSAAAPAVTSGAPAAKPPAPAPTSGAPTNGSVLSLNGSVGAGGKNNPDDVKAVQAALKIAVDGNCSPATIEAIKAFQKSIGQAKPDGRIDIGGPTSSALASRGGGAAAPAPAPSRDANPTPAPVKEVGFLDGLKKKLNDGVLDKANPFAGNFLEGGGNRVGDLVDGLRDLLGDQTDPPNLP